ncbi:MAG: cysteine-rich repeat protein [Bradymonadia bacterium]|jgi:cysteine-rich repeat protein
MALCTAGAVGCGDKAEGGTEPTDVCGDNAVTGAETCDDGNTTAGDGCSATCTTEGGIDAEICGDTLDNDGDGDTDCADSDCAADPACVAAGVCGDGTVDDGEDCDDGNTEDGDGCAADCTTETTTEPVCGDGTLDDGEECDDGNTEDGDGCAADCTTETTTEPVCGDGTLDDGEDCDDGNTEDGDGCAADCTLEPFCGDGILDDGEDCDDGNNESGDGCSSVCTNEVPPAVCGNGVVEDSEVCDDGALNSDSDADACRTDCTFAACGDGVTDTGEDCDGGDSCNEDCSIIPGCGNGFIDEGETCDDGIDNSDLIPDFCRSTCQVASCGDSVTDSGEECDNGVDNGTGECTFECRIDVAAACEGAVDFIVLADAATPTESGLRFDGTFEGTTDDSTPTTGCADEVETAEDVLLVFSVPADGDYRVSTNTLSNVADTVIYRVNDCIDGVPGICNDDDLDSAGSTIFLEGLTAGSSVFLVIDKVAGSPNNFNLTIDAIAGIAAEGEDCSASDVFCAEGLLCTDGQCESNGVPIITEIETVSASPTAVQHIIRGTDINGDVVDWEAPEATMRDGEVLLGLAVAGQPFVEVDGDNFTMEFSVDFGGLNASGPETITYQVFDARGNLSNEFEVTVPEFVPPTTGLLEGDPCDIERLANTCVAPFTCTTDDAGDSSCGTAVEAVISAVRSERTGADGIRVFVTGRDLNADVVSINLDALDRDGNVLEDGIGGFLEDINFLLDNDVTGDIEFEGFVALVGGLFGAESEMTSIRVSVVDAEGLESNELIGNFDAPTPVGLNAQCDLDGITSACTAAFDCSPLEGGGATCQVPVAPALDFVEAFYTDETQTIIRYEVVGTDSNADLDNMTIVITQPLGSTAPIVIAAADLTPNPFGRTAFAFSFEINGGGDPWTDTDVFIQDARGQISGTINDALFAEGELGATCTTDGTGGACDTALGLVCGAASDVDGLNRCEVAVAPVFVALTAERIDSASVRFFLSGSDANGDVVNWSGTLIDDAGTDLLGGDQALAIDDDIRGIVEFNVPSTIAGFDVFPTATTVAMNLLDSAGLLSETRLTVAIPPLRLLGDECVGDGVTDLCEDGSDCVEGICAGAAPEIFEVSAIQDEDNTRLLSITTLGADANEDLVLFTFNFFDEEGLNVLGGPVELTPSEADPVTIVYEEGEFESVDVLNWNFPEILGVSRGSVLVTDSLGLTSEVIEFTFRPTLAVLELCDVLEEDNICRAGLFCDDSGDDAVCDIDTLDPCEGVETISAEDEGEFVEGEGLFVAFNTNGNDNIETSVCDGFLLGGGGEAAILYEADFNGILTATTDTEATGTFDTVLYARANSCTATEAQLDCNDDLVGLASEISMNVVVGDIIFVFIDGFGAGGIGEVLFIEEPQAGEGESCEEIVCIDSLFCDFENICVPLGATGDDCLDVPCAADLACGLNDTCGELGGEEESCEEFPCIDGLFCGAGNVCVTLGAIGDDCSEVPCEVSLGCGVADICEAVGSCGGAVELNSGANSVSIAAGLDELVAPAGCTSSIGSLEFVGSFDATATGTVTFDTGASLGGDSVLWVTEGLCGDEAPVLDCNDDDPLGGFFSIVNVNVTEGTRYFVVVESWAFAEPATAGDYVLTITP